VALGGTPDEESMQLHALHYLRELAVKHPESGVHQVKLTDVPPPGGQSPPWFAGPPALVPDFVNLDYPADQIRFTYRSVVVNPKVFLPWLTERLQKQGVVFRRIPTVERLVDVKRALGPEHKQDLLVNASGLASATLEDVKDDEMALDRTYVTVIKLQYQDAFVRHDAWPYTYIFGRGNGTTVVGGVSDPTTERVKTTAEVHRDVSLSTSLFL